MHRRLFFALPVAWFLGRARAQEAPPHPRHKVSARELHEAMSARFPVRAGAGGMLELEVSAPRLLLLPARQLVGAALALQVGGAGLPRAVDAGEMEVAFALRYEDSDQSIRAHRLEILDMRWPGLPPDAVRTLRRVLPALAREAIGEFIVYRLTPRQLSLAEALGFKPDRITVVEDGIVLEFGPSK